MPALYVVDDATIDWLAAYANAGGHLGWPTLPEPVTVTTGTSLDGRRVHVVHNWSWEPTSADRRGSITQTAVGGGNQVWTLVPHGSRHLIENVATGRFVTIAQSVPTNLAKALSWSEIDTPDQYWTVRRINN